MDALDILLFLIVMWILVACDSGDKAFHFDLLFVLRWEVDILSLLGIFISVA